MPKAKISRGRKFVSRSLIEDMAAGTRRQKLADSFSGRHSGQRRKVANSARALPSGLAEARRQLVPAYMEKHDRILLKANISRCRC